MTIFDALKLLAGATADELVAFLNSIAQNVPNLAPTAQKLLAELQAGASVENLVSLAEALPSELANIAQAKLDPREHPSDAI